MIARGSWYVIDGHFRRVPRLLRTAPLAEKIMYTEDSEKQITRVDKVSRSENLKTDAVVTHTDVEKAEEARTNRFKSVRKMPTLQPGMTREQAQELESQIDPFGIDFGDAVLTSDGIQSKEAIDPHLSTASKPETTTDEIPARDKDYDGGAFKIPNYPDKESREIHTPENTLKAAAEFRAERLDETHSNPSNFPVEQAFVAICCTVKINCGWT